MAGLIVAVPAVAVNLSLIVGHTYFGLGYALGPPRFTASGTYTVALQVLPAQVWGWLILAGAGLSLVAPWCSRLGSTVLHLLAAAPLLAFAAALAASDVLGYSEGWGAPPLFLIPAVAHLLIVSARHRAEVSHVRS